MSDRGWLEDKMEDRAFRKSFFDNLIEELSEAEAQRDALKAQKGEGLVEFCREARARDANRCGACALCVEDWQKATGYTDPEALDSALGRAGIDHHLDVLRKMRMDAEQERDNHYTTLLNIFHLLNPKASYRANRKLDRLGLIAQVGEVMQECHNLLALMPDNKEIDDLKICIQSTYRSNQTGSRAYRWVQRIINKVEGNG